MASTESEASDLHSRLLGFYAPRMGRGTESEYNQLMRSIELWSTLANYKGTKSHVNDTCTGTELDDLPIIS